MADVFIPNFHPYAKARCYNTPIIYIDTSVDDWDDRCESLKADLHVLKVFMHLQMRVKENIAFHGLVGNMKCLSKFSILIRVRDYINDEELRNHLTVIYNKHNMYTAGPKSSHWLRPEVAEYSKYKK